MSASMKRARRILIVTGCVCGPAWWWRPQGLRADDLAAKPRRDGWISKQGFTDNGDKQTPIPLAISRQVILFFGVTLGRLWLTMAGKFSIKDDANYRNFVEQVLARDPDTPLMTVSNHRSLIDDPCIFSSLLPYYQNIQPRYIRYSLCAQEYCFNDAALPSLVHAIAGAGKVLPILRGAGINQPLLLDYAHLLAASHWVHMYPEGGIWQLPELGGRKGKRAEEVGKLKWGVGKLIAHCPKKPKVIVLYFSGLDTAIPQHPETKRVESVIPKPGHQVRVRFSEEIVFDDLIEQYEAQHGKLWKYGDHAVDPTSSDAKSNRKDGESDLLVAGERWISTAQELQLYSQITRRIEQVLTRLNQDSNAELGLAKEVA